MDLSLHCQNLWNLNDVYSVNGFKLLTLCMYLFWIYRTRYFFSITCNCSWSDSNVDRSVFFPACCKEVTHSFILNTTSKIQIKNKSNPELHKLFASGSIQYFHVQKMIKQSLSSLKKRFIMINYSQQKMFKSLFEVYFSKMAISLWELSPDVTIQ